MGTLKVVITERIHEQGITFLKEQGVDVELLYETERPVVEALTEADGMVVRINKATEQLLTIGKANRLKVVGKHGMGVDNIDVDAARQKGIRVVYTLGVMANAVAEFTIGALLLVTKKYMMYDRAARQGQWMIRYTADNFELKGKTLGIIGYGHIGRRVAQPGAGFGMKIVVCDPYVTVVEPEIPQVSLETLLKGSNFISIHVPLTDETYRLIGMEELDIIKKGAYIVNTARGGIIDEEALCDAIKRGQVAGAVLDTTEEEPITVQNPILACPQVTLTAHTAGISDVARVNISTLVCQQVLQVLHGIEPPHVIV